MWTFIARMLLIPFLSILRFAVAHRLNSSHYPQRQASLHASRSSNATRGRGKVERNANYAASSSTATTTTTTCLLMGERERGRRWRGREKYPVILRLPPAHDPLLLLPLDLRRAWSMASTSRSRDRVPSAWAPHVAHARRRRTSRQQRSAAYVQSHAETAATGASAV
ncbi:hypothetical protein B0H13DRAFT_2045530 [Mycena leptocephala]|nr:hypothetical protein B0H13DRAFT_2045530 [Mycena leptocephala]